MATVSEIQGVLKLKGGDRFARQVRSKLDNVKKSFLNLNTAIKGAGFFLFAKKAIDAANIQEQAVARLGAALKSTNNEIGLTVQQLRKMASGLQKVGIFGDEVVMQAQAILLTFTKIGKDIFPEATEIVLDLSAALDQDLKTSAIQLGKALNDPIRGMDTLSRSGIQFSIEQKKVIKGLVNTGNLFEAQKLILKELNTQFGGMNRQLAETSAGAMKQFSNAWGDLLEKGGSVLKKILIPIIEILQPLVEWLNNASVAVTNFIAALGIVTSALWLFRGAIQALFPALGPVGWIITGLTLAGSLFGIFQVQAKGATSSMAEFRKEIRGFNVEQLKQRLHELNIEMATFASGEGLQGPGQAGAMAARRRKVLQEQIAAIEKQINALDGLNKIQAQKQTDTTEALTKEEKALLDERLQNQFEHQQISRAQFLAHLRQRIGDFKDWSDEWTGLHDQITQLEKDAALERQAIESKLARNVLKIRSDFLNKFKEINERANTEDRDNARQRLEEMKRIVEDKVMFITNAFGRMGDALAQSFANANFNPAKLKLKEFFKEILLSTLEFIQRYFILAKIKALVDLGLGFIATLKSVAPLIAANALLEGVKGQIAAMAHGGLVTQPTLALIGEAGRPEIVAPERDFLSFSNMLIDRVVGQRPSQTFNQGGVTLVNNFNTPLQDRRMARKLAAENRMEVRREMKRSKRFLNERT